MYRKKLVVLFGIAMAKVTLMAIPQAALAEEGTWRVTPEQARCLIDNIDVYLSSSSDIVVIPVETCPFPSISIDSLEGLANYGGISKLSTKKSEDNLDTIISYTTKEFICLKSISVKVDDGVAFLPRQLKC